MRRIPRLRRPSGLTSSTTSPISRPMTGSSSNIAQHSQRPAPFSSSSQNATPAFTSRTQSFSPSLSRFYSSSSDKQEKTPTIHAQEDQVQESRTETGTGTELQHKSIVADEVIGAETATNEWVDIDEANLSGPYAVPPERIEAARVEDVADPTYAPASSAAGLKTVGGLSDWWSRPQNWGAGGDFLGFRPRDKVVEPSLIEAAVRRAIIEAFALREVGRDEDLVGVWPTTVSKADLQGLLAWDVKSAEDGVVLGGDAATVAEGLRWKDEGDVAAGEEGQDQIVFSEALTAEEATALSQTWNPSWKAISLADPRIRFAVTKRVFQLTGQLVPDHQLQSINTVQTLLHVLKKPPKPATLTQELQKRHPDLLALPNVTVAQKRVTKGDKEVALGRFKLMQEEFKKRQLPTYGHGYARKGKETSRLRGGT
ncbi:ribosomal subunit 39S-domain-containing protein [Xylaria sp. FL0933]|nr:ribosomal subunit 39S-domain-containing protein [Xylaria sp. FL0933]